MIISGGLAERMFLIKSNKGQLGFIRVIFLAIAFLLIFSLGLAKVMSDSVEIFTVQWGSSYPLFAFIVGGMNIWVFIGFIIAIIGAIVWGISLFNDE